MTSLSRDALPAWGEPAVDAVVEVLGCDLSALSLFGSAAAGRMRASSDLDLLAVTTGAIAAPRFERLAQRLLAVSTWDPATRQGHPVELTVVALPDVNPWRYPPRRQFQFGEWLRPRLARGEIDPPCEDPDLALLLASARAESIALHGPPLAALIGAIPVADLRRAIVDALPAVLQHIAGDERNVILTLARLWLTAATGDIASKDAAAARWMESLAPGHRMTLDLARRGYLGEVDDDWRGREEEVRRFVEAAEREIRNLLRG